jgi:hypothetical protein
MTVNTKIHSWKRLDIEGLDIGARDSCGGGGESGVHVFRSPGRHVDVCSCRAMGRSCHFVVRRHFNLFLLVEGWMK